MDDFDEDAALAGGALPAWHAWPLPGRRAVQQQQPPRKRGAAAAALPSVDDILGGLGDGLSDCDEDEGSDDDAEEGAAAGCSGSGDEGEGDDGGSEAGGSEDGSEGGRGSEGGSQRGGGSEGGGEEDEEALAAAEDVDPEDLVEADFALSRTAVIARIEGFISDCVAAIAAGQLPELEVVSRAEGNAHMVVDAAAAAVGLTGGRGGADEDEGWLGDSESEEGGSGSQAAAAQGGGGGGGGGRRGARLRLGARTQTKSLVRNQGKQAYTIARVFKVLEAAHALLLTGRQATQRDLYYTLQDHELLPNAAAVNAAVQDAVALLRVPRSGLGIACASRGAAAGLIQIRDGPGGAWTDCAALGMGGYAIPGELAAVERLSFRVTARYILVVEKDAVLQRLAEDRLHEALPVAMVTAKGQPDLATRAFLCRLCAAAPHLPVLGLVDWNPAGACILATFKFGNPRLGLEGSRYAVPRLRWLGVTSGMLGEVPRSAFHALTPRDTALLPGLRRRLAGHRGWLGELEEMEEQGLKCDIEALYSVCGFEGLHRLLARRILQQQYL